jgi:hypothetical protein
MNKTLQAPRWVFAAAAGLFVLTVAATPGGSCPARQALPSMGTPASGMRCALTRVGTQLSRCDDLSGAGVRAPLWIPSR